MTKREASKIKVGDRVDLKGDAYADNVQGLLGDFETIVEVVERPGCIAVTFESGIVCGFPPDHVVKIHKRKA